MAEENKDYFGLFSESLYRENNLDTSHKKANTSGQNLKRASTINNKDKSWICVIKGRKIVITRQPAPRIDGVIEGINTYNVIMEKINKPGEIENKNTTTNATMLGKIDNDVPGQKLGEKLVLDPSFRKDLGNGVFYVGDVKFNRGANQIENKMDDDKLKDIENKLLAGDAEQTTEKTVQEQFEEMQRGLLLGKKGMDR